MIRATIWLCGYVIYFLTVLRLAVNSADGASIPWSKRTADSSGVWYFQTGGASARSRTGTKFFASDTLPTAVNKCDEPKNLPQQFMEWFRESTTDPAILALTLGAAPVSIPTTTTEAAPSSDPQTLDSLIAEPDSCDHPPSTEPDASTMERALCPWEWRLNRDETREPKLISEARCLCRRSRGGGSSPADCVPIQREFPVLRRIYCDENGNYQYVKGYETITVGCHSVMPRISRALPWHVRPKEI